MISFENEPLETQYEYTWNIDKAIKEAEESNFTVYRSEPTKLLLDLDDIPAYKTYEKMLKKIQHLYDLKVLETWESKSGKGIHVVLSCKPLDFLARIALQACLGSDKVREALAVKMHLDGITEPSVLFRPNNVGK